ncbi:MAG: AMP-binding protein, partial [Myxococcota bacterium]|nr:AMP-binding protein [Myxococcota bacterium]
MELHYATLWEAIADRIGEREAVVAGSTRRTWREYDERAARIAQAFGEAGLGPDSKVGLYLYNGAEYLESQFACFKGRHVPVNVNYRYLDDELLYLLDNSDAEVLVFHKSLGDRVARVMDKAPEVKLWVQVDDGEGEEVPGAVDFETLVTSHDAAPRIARSADDVYMLYTGGTTGMPKGVMYNIGGMLQGFIGLAFPLFGLGTPTVDEVPDVVVKLWDEQGGLTSIPACPLMHGTGMWLGAMIPHCAGGRVVTLQERSFDAHELWRTAQDEKARQIVLVGDAFAKPMLRALEEAKAAGTPYDLESVQTLVSSGVMWTSEVKQQLLEWSEFMLIDAMGSTEGSMGTQITTRGNVGET